MTLEVRSLRTATFTTWSSTVTRGVTLPRNRRFPFLLSRAVHGTWFTWLDVGSALQPFGEALGESAEARTEVAVGRTGHMACLMNLPIA